MRIAISDKPLSSGHSVRGIGSYTKNLIESLEKKKSIYLVKFSNINEVKDVDVVHYTWFDLFFRTLPLKKNTPTVVTVHDVIPLVFSERFPMGVRGRLNFFYQRISLRGSKIIITDSQSSKQDLVKYLGIKEGKIRVIPLAQADTFKVLADTTLIRISNKYKLPHRYLLYVGDVNYSKNLPFLIKAFAILKEADQFKDLKLLLVGHAFLKKSENIDHSELASLKEVNSLIISKNLESEIIRLGFIEVLDLVGIYNLATIYIQPSLYEGFGIPVLEAMSCGVPVLSSNKSSLPEVGGNAAVYFDPTNLEKFIEILKEILLDRSVRKELSIKGLEQAKKFSLERVVDETIAVYKQSLKT